MNILKRSSRITPTQFSSRACPTAAMMMLMMMMIIVMIIILCKKPLFLHFIQHTILWLVCHSFFLSRSHSHTHSFFFILNNGKLAAKSKYCTKQNKHKKDFFFTKKALNSVKEKKTKKRTLVFLMHMVVSLERGALEPPDFWHLSDDSCFES